MWTSLKSTRRTRQDFHESTRTTFFLCINEQYAHFYNSRVFSRDETLEMFESRLTFNRRDKTGLRVTVRRAREKKKKMEQSYTKLPELSNPAQPRTSKILDLVIDQLWTTLTLKFELLVFVETKDADVAYYFSNYRMSFRRFWSRVFVSRIVARNKR